MLSNLATAFETASFTAVLVCYVSDISLCNSARPPYCRYRLPDIVFLTIKTSNQRSCQRKFG